MTINKIIKFFINTMYNINVFYVLNIFRLSNFPENNLFLYLCEKFYSTNTVFSRKKSINLTLNIRYEYGLQYINVLRGKHRNIGALSSSLLYTKLSTCITSKVSDIILQKFPKGEILVITTRAPATN